MFIDNKFTGVCRIEVIVNDPENIFLEESKKYI